MYVEITNDQQNIPKNSHYYNETNTKLFPRVNIKFLEVYETLHLFIKLLRRVLGLGVKGPLDPTMSAFIFSPYLFQ